MASDCGRRSPRGFLSKSPKSSNRRRISFQAAHTEAGMKNFSKAGMTLWLLLFCLPSSAAQTDKPTIIVFAAASLTNALQEVGDGFTRVSSIPVKFSFAASSALARQIESGAPADVFFSADLEWMDYLQTRNLIRSGSRAEGLGKPLGPSRAPGRTL